MKVQAHACNDQHEKRGSESAGEEQGILAPDRDRSTENICRHADDINGNSCKDPVCLCGRIEQGNAEKQENIAENIYHNIVKQDKTAAVQQKISDIRQDLCPFPAGFLLKQQLRKLIDCVNVENIRNDRDILFHGT